MLIQSQKYSVSSKGTLGGLQGVKPGWTTFMYFVLEGWNFDMWCISDSYKTFIIDTFAHFAQKKIYRPLFQKTDFVALIRPHRVLCLKVTETWNKSKSMFAIAGFAVSCPFSVKVLHLIGISTIHTHSHIRTVDAKVLSKLSF